MVIFACLLPLLVLLTFAVMELGYRHLISTQLYYVTEMGALIAAKEGGYSTETRSEGWKEQATTDMKAALPGNLAVTVSIPDVAVTGESTAATYTVTVECTYSLFKMDNFLENVTSETYRPSVRAKNNAGSISLVSAGE